MALKEQPEISVSDKEYEEFFLEHGYLRRGDLVRFKMILENEGVSLMELLDANPNLVKEIRELYEHQVNLGIPVVLVESKIDEMIREALSSCKKSGDVIDLNRYNLGRTLKSSGTE